MNERKPYDQGWLDGVNAQAREDAAWAERANRVEAAATKLAEVLDQSKLIKQLRAELEATRQDHAETELARQVAVAERDTAQADLDEAREYLQSYDNIGDDGPLISDVREWLRTHPARAQ